MTREELKEHCKRQIQQFERVEKIMPVTPNDWKRYEEHKLILELLEQEPRWIPVSERLPTKEEYIANNGLFIVSDGNRTYVEYFVIYKSIKCFCTMNGFRVDRCVTAWMPLPTKPYKAESEPQESEEQMDKEWEVEFTIEGKTSFFCDTKEEAEKMAHDYLSELCQGLYPDCCSNSYEIENIYSNTDD